MVKVGKMERAQMGTMVLQGESVAGWEQRDDRRDVDTEEHAVEVRAAAVEGQARGSFVLTLQSVKRVLFERSNPARIGERNSKWRFARLMPSNPLDELSFTSEGGEIFTNAQFDDTMKWRFPKHMDGKKMRWNIEGQIPSTYTITRYFETGMASFCGDIEEPLKPLQVKDKNGNPKFPKLDSDKKPPKADKADKVDKGDKPPKPLSMSHYADADYLEFLEFKNSRRDSLGSSQELAARKMSGFLMPQNDNLGNAVAIEIMQREQSSSGSWQPESELR